MSMFELLFVKSLAGGGGGGGGSTPQNFSTTEQDTGVKFVDGKSIYWITFTDVPDYIDVTSLNIDTLIEGTFVTKWDDEGTPCQTLFGSGENNYLLEMYTENEKDKLQVGRNQFQAVPFVTIYYTKK